MSDTMFDSSRKRRLRPTDESTSSNRTAGAALSEQPTATSAEEARPITAATPSVDSVGPHPSLSLSSPTAKTAPRPRNQLTPMQRTAGVPSFLDLQPETAVATPRPKFWSTSRTPTAGASSFDQSPATAAEKPRPNDASIPMDRAAGASSSNRRSKAADAPRPKGRSIPSFAEAHSLDQPSATAVDGARPIYRTTPIKLTAEPQPNPELHRPIVLAAPKIDPVGAGDELDPRFADPLVAQIRQHWRNRQVWHRAEKSLTLQMSALCRAYVGVHGKADKAGLKRAAELLKQQTENDPDGLALIMRSERGDDVATSLGPLFLARLQLEPLRAKIEKDLANLAKQLPIASIVTTTKGFGLLSLAGIVGEAGAIGEYRTVQGLWKRMGLAVIEGERQRKKSDADEALLHGYSPPRRSVMWNVGSSLIGFLGHGPRPRVGEDIDTREDLSHWQKMFLHRLRHEAAADPAHRRPDAERKGEVFESYSKHAANRARRYVEKQFLKKLWQDWRETSAQEPNVTQDAGG